MDLDNEILRIRNRLHKMSSDVTGLKYRVEDLEKDRDKTNAAVERLMEEKEIDLRVKARLKEQNTLYLSTVQKAGEIGRAHV